MFIRHILQTVQN